MILIILKEPAEKSRCERWGSNGHWPRDFKKMQDGKSSGRESLGNSGRANFDKPTQSKRLTLQVSGSNVKRSRLGYR